MAVVAITAGEIQVVNGCKEGTAGEDVQEMHRWPEAEERQKRYLECQSGEGVARSNGVYSEWWVLTTAL